MRLYFKFESMGIQYNCQLKSYRMKKKYPLFKKFIYMG